MYIIRDHSERISDFVRSCTSKAFTLAWGVLLVAIAALAVLYYWIGAPAFNGMAFDASVFLDGSWRITNGQVPHKDFYVDFGDLILYVGALGLKLGRTGVAALATGNIFVMVPLGLAAMLVLQRRTSAFYALLFSLYIVFLSVTPRPLGVPYYNTAYAMIYNRYGECFLALLAAILFLTPDPARKKGWADWAEIAFAGLCLTMLVFCKLNYFMMGAAFFVVAFCLRRFSLPQVVVFLVSAAAFMGVMLALTGIPFGKMAHDYQIMAGAQGGAENLGHRIFQVINRGVENIILLPVLLLIPWEISRSLNAQEKAWPHFVVMIAIFGGALLLLASNTQPGEMPLLALAALYGAETIRRQTGPTDGDQFFPTARTLGAVLLFLFFLFPTFGTDLRTMIFLTKTAKTKSWVSTDTLESTRLGNFRRTVSVDTDLTMMQRGMDLMDEGIQLLRRHPEAQSRLTVFLQEDPYHYALNLPPPEGGVVSWTTDGITKRSHPDLKRLIGNANYILASPNGHTTVDDIKAAYGPEWDALNLQVVEQTKDFTLLKLPDAASPTP